MIYPLLPWPCGSTRRLRQSKRVRGREDGAERLALGAISRRVEEDPALRRNLEVGLEGGPAADRRPPLRPAELAHSPRVCGGEDGVPGAWSAKAPTSGYGDVRCITGVVWSKLRIHISVRNTTGSRRFTCRLECARECRGV